jgi:IS30 family transposase
MKKYHQLTQEQRYTIYILWKESYSQSAIARFINVHKSTVSRELRRNSGLKGYRYKQAHKRYLERRHKAAKYTSLTGEMKQNIIELLGLTFSPEQIVGFCKAREVDIVSHERIYQFIWENKRRGGYLYKFLRCSQKKKRKRYGSKDSRGIIKNRIFIDERPEIVEDKQRLGDLEIDTITGKGRTGYLITMVDRKSKYTFLGKCNTKHSNVITQKIISIIDPVKDLIHTITADNGKEFADHENIAQRLNVDVYFAHPYCSWERGLNENTNGLIRQFFPKNHDFSTITDKELCLVAHLLNHRPRKTLDFKTPHEVFCDNLN